MRKMRKTIISVVVALFIIMQALNVNAYTEAIDTNDNIQISDTLTNGSGKIEVTRDITDYSLSYQLVEIDNNLYKQIKKLKDQLLLIEYFNLYEMSQSDEDYDVYASAVEYYRNAYGEDFTELTDVQADENISIIISLLPEFNDSWKTATNGQFDMDLSSFSGTKDYVVWAKVEKKDGTKIYDANIFEVTGTKSEESDENKIDKNDNIKIKTEITDGTGAIDVTRDVEDYKLYYQWVEIDEDLYKQIKKLKDQLLLIEYFNLYEMSKNDEDYDVYASAVEYYRNAYGEDFTELTDVQAEANIKLINSLLPKYTDTWIESTDNKFRMDLSSFSGNKKYVLWVQIEKKDGTKIYDAEIFSLVGTKEDGTKTDEGLIDPSDNIFISKEISDGTIDVTRDVEDYKLYYQWVEIDEDLYKQIKKLKDQLELIKYFNLYEMSKSDEDYNVYAAAYEKYRSVYGEDFTELTDIQADENISIINSLLLKYAQYGENWQESTDNKFRMDLSSFSGTKYYALWVKIEKNDGKKIYDAEIFSLIGTKQEEKKDEEKKDEEKTDEEKKDEEKKDEEKKDEEKKDEEKKDEEKKDEEKKDEEKKDEEKTDEEKKDEEKKDEEKKDEEKKDEEKKDEEKKDEEKKDEEKTDEEKKDEEKKDEEKKTEEKKDEEKQSTQDSSQKEESKTNNSSSSQNKTVETAAKTDKTASSETLPYTGIDKTTLVKQGVTLVGIISFVVAAVISFVKYKKMK